jgi:hypothetical protein
MAKGKEKTPSITLGKFPDDASASRLRRYGTYENLLVGHHYSAYIQEAGNEFSERYGFLRYMTCNFAGLLSKVIADVLFGEKVQIESPTKNKEEQKFIDALMYDNNLNVQLYESALFNSARGDALLRVRIEDNQIKIEDVNPAMYFPELDGNFRKDPEKKYLAWRENLDLPDGKVASYMIVEEYTVGLIETKIYRMKDEDSREIDSVVAVDIFNALTGKDIKEKVETGIEKIPLIHIPNFRMESSYWGTSDFEDLQSLFFAINNRMTKIDNILDKHSDPILSLPPGILDEKGEVKKEKLGMIETRDGEGKPEYIVWNANLESAFKQIDEMIKMIFLMGEISPDVVGLDTGRGGAESGRALKLRMVRTLAKKNRKSLYYEQGIKEAIEIASMYAKSGNYKVDDIGYKGDPIVPNIIFADGVVDDKVEEVQNETLKVEAGLTSKKRAIKVIEDMDDEEADALIDEIKKDGVDRADFNLDNLFHKRQAELNKKQIEETKEE